jgi:hypothetical protein
MLGALTVTVAVSLAGCSALFPEGTGSTTATPTAGPSAAAPLQPLAPDSSATDNLPVFAAVMNQVAASPDGVAGRAYIDALVAAGFDKATMQVTADRTSVDDPVDSLQFSVLWSGECLVGQVGPSTPSPTAKVLPQLPSGGCLIGKTRPIDW